MLGTSLKVCSFLSIIGLCVSLHDTVTFSFNLKGFLSSLVASLCLTGLIQQNTISFFAGSILLFILWKYTLHRSISHFIQRIGSDPLLSFAVLSSIMMITKPFLYGL